MKALLNINWKDMLNKDIVPNYSLSTLLLIILVFTSVYTVITITDTNQKVHDMHSGLFTQDMDIILEVID